MSRSSRRIPRSLATRAFHSIVLIALVVAVGTLGMNALEGMSYLDAFYFMSMLATGQGPNHTPVTVYGKIFAALMAFVSVGTVISSLVFVFGPFFGRVLREGVEKIEKVEREHEKKSGEHRG